MGSTRSLGVRVWLNILGIPWMPVAGASQSMMVACAIFIWHAPDTRR